MDVIIRQATPQDIPALERLIPESVRALQKKDYSIQQIDGALGTVFGVDSQLIEDGTYLIAEAGSNVIGCGGWSKRRTLFGSNHIPGKDDMQLDPARDAARIRAFFVHPAWARQGIGSKILQACEAAATAQRFHPFRIGSDPIGRTPIPRLRLQSYRAF